MGIMLQIDARYLDKLTEAFYLLLKGRKAEKIVLPADHPQDEFRQLTEYINRFVENYNIFTDAMDLMVRGELDFEIPRGGMSSLHQIKSLQASLRHLTWKTQQIAGGDFDQKVDFMGDFSTAFNRMTLQLKEAFEKIEQQHKKLQAAYEEIQLEKEKSDRLLLNILPIRVANDLKATGHTVPQTFENVTVAFSDIVGFTHLSSQLDPKTLIDELNEIFTGFDMIIESNECERIKTIGDAYLAVSGMNNGNARHAENIVNAACQIIRYLEKRNATSPFEWKIRMGIHTGKVVGGVVGIKKYIYDVFGDTINTACRMEQNSEPMKINISEATYDLIKDKFSFFERNALEVKGKGMMKMYFVTGTRFAAAPSIPIAGNTGE
jgi:class 3 adenylate cyclase